MELFNQEKTIFMDGGMGTMLQARGLQAGQAPDLWNITHPQEVEAVHRAYLEAGSQWISTNTFGTNAKKLAQTGESVSRVVTAAVACAKRAAQGYNAKILLDVGPLGTMLEPMGTLPFEEAYRLFQEVVCEGEKAGVDGVLFETITDLYEVRAAVLAAKENTSLPVWVSMSFESNGRTFCGTPVQAFALTAQGLGVDAVGINCSLGPNEILPMAKTLSESTDLPVFIKANAGLPDPSTGEYSLQAEEYVQQMKAYLPLSLAAVGGCCGTTPDYIRALTQVFSDKKPKKASVVKKSFVCSGMNVVEIDGLTVIGERINPTGKPRMKEALRAHSMDFLMRQAVEQTEAGAQILDVNVGLPGIDEAEMMVKAVKAVQSVTELPLQLDSTKAEVLEAGLRVYNGKPIVNSVNAEDKVLKEILPLCKKYGAAVVGLTLDESGIPNEAEKRFALAEKIVRTAEEYGIPREDVYIDCLTLTASAQQEAVWQTLLAVRMVKERLGVKTVLGVSNVSFGLPCREQLNTAFLTLAAAHGLDLPIMNPNNDAMMAAVRACRVLDNHDGMAQEYIAKYGGQTPAPAAVQTNGESVDLTQAVLQGLKPQAAQAAREALAHTPPEELVTQVLIPALDEVGDRFEKGTSFLPQLLQSAGAAQAAFDVVKDAIAARGKSGESFGKIVIATVHGDVHDIGKNIVKVILENYGFEMIDLGKDVPEQDVVDAVKRTGAKLVGLSALMTTTLPAMERTIAMLREQVPGCVVMVGGAVLTPDYAKTIGADYYAKDAKASVDIARKVLCS